MGPVARKETEERCYTGQTGWLEEIVNVVIDWLKNGLPSYLGELTNLELSSRVLHPGRTEGRILIFLCT